MDVVNRKVSTLEAGQRNLSAKKRPQRSVYGQRNNPRCTNESFWFIEGYFISMLGSGIYVTSAFFSFEREDSLVHWTHSFCIFIIARLSSLFKMENSIRNAAKSYEILRIDKPITNVLQ